MKWEVLVGAGVFALALACGGQTATVDCDAVTTETACRAAPECGWYHPTASPASRPPRENEGLPSACFPRVRPNPCAPDARMVTFYDDTCWEAPCITDELRLIQVGVCWRNGRSQ